MAGPEITSGLAGEAGHWYATDGSPAYEIPAKDGRLRPVTLRDARKHGFVPSVTMIQKCAAAPALEAWKVKQGILSALTLPRRPGETETEFADRVLADSREQAAVARRRGTVIHAQIERSFTEHCDPDFWPYVEPVLAWLRETFIGVDFQAERSFASSLGFGGKVDLYARVDSVRVDGPEPTLCSGVVIDFKSKDFTREQADTVRAYDEHGVQLAAYAVGLGFPTDAPPLRANLFVSTREPGLIVPHIWPPDSFHRHWSMFKGLLDYWRADKGYAPGGEK